MVDDAPLLYDAPVHSHTTTMRTTLVGEQFPQTTDIAALEPTHCSSPYRDWER